MKKLTSVLKLNFVRESSLKKNQQLVVQSWNLIGKVWEMLSLWIRKRLHNQFGSWNLPYCLWTNKLQPSFTGFWNSNVKSSNWRKKWLKVLAKWLNEIPLANLTQQARQIIFQNTKFHRRYISIVKPIILTLKNF